LGRVFYYEFRRQAANKFFAGLLALCLAVAWLTLSTSVIKGVAGTAPFSAWSFGCFMAQMQPLFALALLFGLRTVFSPAARQAGELTSATPVDKRAYGLVKCGAVAASWLIILICTIALGLGFLISIFGNALPAGEIMLVCVLETLPAAAFFFGAGLLAGQLNKWPGLAALFMAAVISFLPLPGYAALFDIGFYTQYPLSLGVTDPALSLPAAFIAGKAAFAAAGALLIFVNYRVISTKLRLSVILKTTTG